MMAKILEVLIATDAELAMSASKYIGWCVSLLLVFRLSYWASDVFPWAGLSPRYATLSKLDKIEWHSRVVSNINAAVCVIGAGYGLAWMMWESVADVPGGWYRISPPLLVMTYGGLCGYLIHDLHLILTTPSLYSLGMMAHHVIGICGSAYAWWSGLAGGACVFFLLTEATTPLINARWFLTKTGARNSSLYTLNGVAIFVAWTFLRASMVVIAPIVFYRDWHHFGHDYPTNIIIIGTTVAVGSLNLYWYYLIVRGLLKLLGLRGSASSTASAKRRD
ncbi:transmembrane protein 56 [Thecamonas trahens ATCC 50062]|uniref:Transmembrane protein 56 n=1 Tax=Thecamonas trahens ATCC 50062 TaxID=461836 RepID=A0A0L0DE28_THETB|nr:transmembrane protein 56 [Thecamonas trahens ATCC 50062]KNC50421.1 transmembrane protein 56 [Thecamonas trahens ATCC 50062]|eukprot:XP_013756963.1 transmembrane protein 56 [Thecamonas trahens ATCC 50062]